MQCPTTAAECLHAEMPRGCLQPLGDIANVEHFVPRDWISEDGCLPNEKFVEYARPLIEGEVKYPLDGGLPKYVVLEKSKVEKKLPPRS